jgi:hypothetical protein
MAARKRKIFLNDEWKDKIRAGAIMARLLGHVQGELEMSGTQIKAADIILKKIVPDLARSEVTGPDGGPQEMICRWQQEK